MIRCNLCGYTSRDGTTHCPNCGEFLGNGERLANIPGFDEPEVKTEETKAPEAETANMFGEASPQADDQIANMFGGTVRKTDEQTYQASSKSVKQRNMKWYKFLIYFSLFASAAANALNGVRYITGDIYGEYAYLVYDALPRLKTIDILMGVGCLLVAVLCFIARGSLAKMKSKGPALLICVYVAAFLLSTIYYFAVNSIGTNDVIYISYDLPSNAVTVFMIIVNGIYFKNRKHMFIY